MHHAARDGDVMSLAQLISGGALGVNEFDEKKRTPLMRAAAYGHDACIELLLGSKANVDNLGTNGWTALFYAASHGHPTTVELLLQANASPHVKDTEDGSEAMTQARYGGHTEALRILEMACAKSEKTAAPLSLTAQYLSQFGFRHSTFQSILEDIRRHGFTPEKPERPHDTKSVQRRLCYDLGCGPGLVSNLIRTVLEYDLVVGLDSNAELIEAARQVNPNASGLQFVKSDVLHFERSPFFQGPADGVWASFVFAYFADSSLRDAFLETVTACVKLGGWLCLLEITGLFVGHAPMSAEFTQQLERAQELMLARGYDCAAGAGMAAWLEGTGAFRVVHSQDVPDPELACSGPITAADILGSWSQRWERVAALRTVFPLPQDFDAAKADFLQLLQRKDHSCSNTVRIVLCQRV